MQIYKLNVDRLNATLLAMGNNYSKPAQLSHPFKIP